MPNESGYAPMTTRALFSLSEEIMDRFRELVPSRERSALIERLLRKELAERETARERELERIVQMIETDDDFADVRAVSSEVDGIAGEAIE
jgi:metal-responsive CopG/Arc/MetJ family transcriptional regulator